MTPLETFGLGIGLMIVSMIGVSIPVLIWFSRQADKYYLDLGGDQ